MIRMCVELSNGTILKSDMNNEMSRAELEDHLDSLLVNWSRVNNLRVIKNGHVVYVNPAHVCAVWIEED